MDVDKIIAIGFMSAINIICVSAFVAVTIQTEQGNTQTNKCYETLKHMNSADLRITCGGIK